MEKFELTFTTSEAVWTVPFESASAITAAAAARVELQSLVARERPTAASVAVFAGSGGEAVSLGVWDYDSALHDFTWTPED